MYVASLYTGEDVSVHEILFIYLQQLMFMYFGGVNLCLQLMEGS